MARPPCCWKADYAASRPVVTAAGQGIELAISEKHDAFHGRPPLRGVRRARLARRSSVPSEAEASSLLAEAVERLGILHQDAVARSLVGGPLAQEVEQECVVRLVVVGQARVRPVAPPDQALRRRLDERLRDLGGLRVGARAALAVRIGARDFPPRAALVDQLADDLVR